MTTSKIELPGHTKDGKLEFDSQQIRDRKRWLKDMGQSAVIETLEKKPKKRKPKTPNQLGYIFAGIIDTVKRTLDERGACVKEGAPYTEGQIKKVLYFQHHVKNGGTLATFEDKYQTLSQHNDRAITSEFIDFSLQWLAGTPWQIFVPDPRPRSNV